MDRMTTLRAVHAVIKTVRRSGASGYGGTSSRTKYMSGDYATRSKLTIVGIARGILSGDWAWAQVAMVGTTSGTAYMSHKVIYA